MKPVIVLVGRPNVGKSTLFNRLTRSRDALVADRPGLTRDRKFGEGRVGERPYIVVDTGGLSGEVSGVESAMQAQSWLAVEQADIVLFLVDARAGISAMDEDIAQRLRVSGKRVHVVANKAEGLATEVAVAEFAIMGLGDIHAISAAHGDGVNALMGAVLEELPISGEHEEEEVEKGIKIAIVGRPNVGKSTLLNRMLGEERVVAFDEPGTTRDSVYVPFERDGQRYTLIDTAGVRRRARVKQAIEKFSVIKTLQAIEDAHVVVMVLDAREGIGEQDASLLGFVLDAGRALVIAVNKWDGLAPEQRDKVRRDLDLKLPFVDFATILYVSALHGSGVGDVFDAVRAAYESATAKFSTPELTRLLEDLVAAHQPPLARGRRIKLRYAHQGGQNPPVIVIHGNQTERLPSAYRRYLANGFRKHLRLVGTPLRIELRTGENPFRGKRNVLTARQQAKRKRLVRHQKTSR